MHGMDSQPVAPSQAIEPVYNVIVILCYVNATIKLYYK